jgi:hypothetical protein
LGGFFLCSPDCPKQPRTSFPFYKLFYPIVSAKVSELNPLANPGYINGVCTCLGAMFSLVITDRNKSIIAMMSTALNKFLVGNHSNSTS